MTYLDCGYNNLKSLDVSKNTALTYLDCGYNNLKSLDVSKNTALTVLYCGNQGLKSLDISKNTALKDLDCNYCSDLKSIDVSKNTELTQLRCAVIGLTSLDVSNNTKLEYLNCSGNRISGTNMDMMVNSLPQVTKGILLVCDDFFSPDNIMSVTQAWVAGNKGWKVRKYVWKKENGNSLEQDYAGKGDTNGNNKINQNDLDLIVNTIMGRPVASDGYAGDLNNDKKVDAADVVEMVNILKSLGK